MKLTGDFSPPGGAKLSLPGRNRQRSTGAPLCGVNSITDFAGEVNAGAGGDGERPPDPRTFQSVTRPSAPATRTRVPSALKSPSVDIAAGGPRATPRGLAGEAGAVPGPSGTHTAWPPFGHLAVRSLVVSTTCAPPSAPRRRKALGLKGCHTRREAAVRISRRRSAAISGGSPPGGGRSKIRQMITWLSVPSVASTSEVLEKKL
mmetsp:Transcript_12834/g.25665  ORF Transcript_12834/g.25665 Transcript_12834/m.25665 type:complete len:204 (-) Transcript_12834:271-882(-)